MDELFISTKIKSSVSVEPKDLNNNLNRKIISILRSLELKNDEKDELIFDIEVELMKGNSKEINKKLQLNRNKSQAYEEIKGMYVRGALETSLSPVTNIKKFVYSEII